jgi:predicted amidohydrolase
MRVAAVQYKAIKGDHEASLAGLLALAERGAEATDLLVLPEMAVTGYAFESVESARTVAEAPEGPTFKALSKIARRHRCWIVSGFPEDAGERLYNSAHVIDPHGELAFVYRKTLLYEADLPWASPGDSGWRTFETSAGSFAVGICMDLNDDGFISWLAEHSPRALAFPTNWIDQEHTPWDYWAWRMIETGTALVAANSYGPDGELKLRGESAILDGTTLLAAATLTGDGVIRAQLPARPPLS